ncbi:ATP-dependent DNA ligase [Nocardia thailandica]
MRALARIDADDGVRLFSRNRRDITASYPELAAPLAAAAAGREMVLGGELVAPDPGGAPSFFRL